MRTSSLLFSCLLLACHAPNEEASGVFVGPAPTLPDSPPKTPRDAGAEGGGGAMIEGTLETDDGQPIIGRPVVVVDARGVRTEVMSDEGGMFHVGDVVRPYDLVVARAPSGMIQNPTVFLGLTRIDPFVELFERDGPTTRSPAQVLRLGVKPPPCSKTACTVVVATGSASGSGLASASYRDESYLLFELEHEWSAPTVGADETITLHVLAYDGDRTTFAYATRDGIRAQPGDLTELGGFETTDVPASAPWTVSVTPHGPVTTTWTPAIATVIDLPGGATIPFTYDGARERVLRLPIVHGATMRANGWMQHPPIADRPFFQNAVQGWTGTRSVDPAGVVVAIELPVPPAPARPAVDGPLSARGLGIAWTNPASAPSPLTEVTVAHATSGVLRYRVWTIGDEIPFARLERLGLEPLTPGDHVLGLTSAPGETLDGIVDPDASARHARSDSRRAGAASYQRFRFQVTP